MKHGILMMAHNNTEVVKTCRRIEPGCRIILE